MISSLLSLVPPAYHDFYKNLEKAGSCLLTVIMKTSVQSDEDRDSEDNSDLDEEGG